MGFNIVHLISSYDVFGAENNIISDSLELMKRSHKITVIIIRPKGYFPFLEKIRRLKIPYYHLISDHKFDIQAVFRLKKLLIELRCDIVHSHGYKSDITALVTCCLLNIPIVTTTHGWTSENTKVKFYEMLQAFSWRFFDRVICVAEFYRKKALCNGVSEEKSVTIYNAIAREERGADKDKKINDDFRHKYNIPKEHFVAGIIGRLGIEKGHRYFIEAAKDIVKDNKNISFVIAGNGCEEDNIRNLIRNSDLGKNFRVIGYIEDMEELYNGLDAVVISSLREGLPNVLLEAMHYGKPVIATTVGGIPEVIRDKEDGLLVPPKNGIAIADALSSIIGNPDKTERMVSLARNKVRDQFNLEAKVDKIERLYAEIISSHRNRS